MHATPLGAAQGTGSSPVADASITPSNLQKANVSNIYGFPMTDAPLLEATPQFPFHRVMSKKEMLNQFGRYRKSELPKFDSEEDEKGPRKPLIYVIYELTYELFASTLDHKAKKIRALGDDSMVEIEEESED